MDKISTTWGKTSFSNYKSLLDALEGETSIQTVGKEIFILHKTSIFAKVVRKKVKGKTEILYYLVVPSDK